MYELPPAFRIWQQVANLSLLVIVVGVAGLTFSACQPSTAATAGKAAAAGGWDEVSPGLFVTTFHYKADLWTCFRYYTSSVSSISCSR